MKSQVREHWRPVEVYRRRDPTGSIYGNKDRYTLLRVQLKPDGSLANLTLQTPSGVEFLDDEAMEAFKQAQPFPNPPPQLVDGGSGMIDFSFGFYFEISGAPRFKTFPTARCNAANVATRSALRPAWPPCAHAVSCGSPRSR